MKKILLLIPVVLLSLSVYVQAQTEYWQREYRIDSITGYYLKDIKVDGYGNYIAAGYADNVDSIKNFLIYINKYGIPLWKKTVNEQYYTYVQKIIIADPSSFLIVCKYVGDTTSIYRIDNGGNILWKKKFGRLGFVKDVIKTSDNKFIISGDYANYPFLLKIDAEGNIIFQKSYEYNFLNIFCELRTQGKFIVVGGLTRGGSLSANIYYLRKLDSIGNVISNTQLNLNQNFVLGKFLYDSTNIYLVGKKGTAQGIYKFDYNFSLIDSSNIESGSDERFISADLVNNNFILCCSKNSNSVVFKTIKPDGSILKQKIINPNQGGVINPYNIYFDETNNSYYSSGFSDFYRNKIAYGYVVKLDSNLNTSIAPIGIKNETEVINNFTLNQNYPNPFNPSTKISYSLKKSSAIELKLFDINGRLIKIIESGFKPAGSYEINFSAEELSSGVYFFSLYSEGILMDTKKAVVLK